MERHDTILIACENSENRRLLRYVLKERFNLLEAANLHQTFVLMRQNTDCIIAFVIADSLIKNTDNRLTEELKDFSKEEDIPIIIISETDNNDDVGMMFRWGAHDVIPISYDKYAMFRRIETISELSLHKNHLETVVHQQEKRLNESREALLDVLSSTIEYRSVESGQHNMRIRNYTKILMDSIMAQCPEYGLTEKNVNLISAAASLHDIGKIAIPDSILMKPGALTAEETELMKTHTITGSEILDRLKGVEDEEYLRYAYNICKYHHERWDGSGYPEGLAGENIPICAQAVGLCDAYEALTSKRVYKDAYTVDKAVNMILNGECGVFSPKLIECFKTVTKDFGELTFDYSDGKDPVEVDFDMSLPTVDTASQNNTALKNRARYISMVHYIGGLMLEVNLEQKLFHVVYNPYPELENINDIATLSELWQFILDKIVVEEQRAELENLLFVTMPQFVKDDLRRAVYKFNHKRVNGQPAGTFEFVLLRDSMMSGNAVGILIRKYTLSEKSSRIGYTGGLLENTCICRNDSWFTFVPPEDDDRIMLGDYTCQDIKDMFNGRLSEIIHPDDREMVRNEFKRQLQKGIRVNAEHRVVLKSGKVIWVANKSQLIVDEKGDEYLQSTIIDINYTHTKYERLKYKNMMYRDILTRTQNVLFSWNIVDDVITFSDTWGQVFDFEPVRQNLNAQLLTGGHFHPDDVPILVDKINNMKSFADYDSVEMRISGDKGVYRWCRLRGHANRDKDNRLIGIEGNITVIDAEKRAEKELKARAETDALTGMLNKAAGKEKIETYLKYYPEGANCAMLIIDLDNFKQINDKYGHLFGDTVLAKVSAEIKRNFREQDIVCRIGGDEFMVITRGLSDRKLLKKRCDELAQSLKDCVKGQYQKLAIECSIGISVCPEHGKTYNELFANGDRALYMAKSSGKGKVCFYTREDDYKVNQTNIITAISAPIDSNAQPGIAEDSIVRKAFNMLYRSDMPEKAINDVIAMLGTHTNVSRVYVFENSEDNKYCKNTFEWCNKGISPEIDMLQYISYETDIPGYENNFDENGVFYCPDIRTLPKEARDIVEAQGIKSMLQCNIRQDGEFRGYIGFDECVEERLWTKEEVNMLVYFSEILSLFLLKYREQQRASMLNEDLKTVLDNQKLWICIVDPESFEIKYINKRAKELRPQAKLGCVCYESIWERKEPCRNCPMLNIKEKLNNSTVFKDGKYDIDVMMEADMIKWQGKDSCLMTCRKIPNL